jgi:hypothetical protein
MAEGSTAAERVVDDYLNELRREARVLPRGRRSELMVEVGEHLEEAVGPDASEADARNAVEALGSPSAIVAAELGDAPPRGRSHTFEWATIALLLFGGFIFFFGWLAGLVMLWASSVWSLPQKLLGTFVLPGGFLASLWAVLLLTLTAASTNVCLGGPGRPTTCHTVGNGPSGPSILAYVLLAIAVIGPFFTAFILARAVRRSPS